MLGGVWLIYFGFGLLSVAMAPLIDPISRDLGLSYTTMGAILGAWPLVYIVAAAPLRRLRRSRRAQVVALSRRSHHHPLGRTACRRLRRRVDVRGCRALRNRRPAGFDRRAQGDHAMVHGHRARLRHGRLHHGARARQHARPDADQQRPDAAQRRQLAPGPADLFRLHPGCRPRLVPAERTSGQPRGRACRASSRVGIGSTGGFRCAAAAAERPHHPRDEHRRLLPPSRARQLAAGDPAHRRHGGGQGGSLGGGPDGNRDRRRADHPEARDAAPALRDPLRARALRRCGRADAADRRRAGARRRSDPPRYRAGLADRGSDPRPDGGTRRRNPPHRGGRGPLLLGGRDRGRAWPAHDRCGVGHHGRVRCGHVAPRRRERRRHRPALPPSPRASAAHQRPEAGAASMVEGRVLI